jgi:hypothetical protein
LNKIEEASNIMIRFLREITNVDDLYDICANMINTIEMIIIGKFQCELVESMIQDGYLTYGLWKAMSRRFANTMSDDFLITHATWIDWKIVAGRRPLRFTFLQRLPARQLKECCGFINFQSSPMSLEEIFEIYPKVYGMAQNQIWEGIILRNLSYEEINFIIDKADEHSHNIVEILDTQLLSAEQITRINWLLREFRRMDGIRSDDD